jgi:hypothetical protein
MPKVACGVEWSLSGKLKHVVMRCRNAAGRTGKCWIHAQLERRKEKLARREKCAHAIYMGSGRVRGCSCLAMEGSAYCRHHKDGVHTLTSEVTAQAAD